MKRGKELLSNRFCEELLRNSLVTAQYFLSIANEVVRFG
jgi:hypothetical protein